MSSRPQELVSLEPRPSADPIVARVPFFYGWVMLPIAMIGQIATSPGQTFGISVFNESFLNDLRLSRTTLAGAYMLGTLLAAIPVSRIGVLMDRHGIRRVMTVVVILFGGTCIATSQVNGVISLFLAFLMLRMLGQGALSLLSSNSIAMWFHARLGTASGLMSVGSAAAFAIIPPTNLYLIDRFGWRWTYVLQGIAVWCVMLPLLALFFRNRPEDIGEVPDGVGARAKVRLRNVGDVDRSMSLSQALRTRAYWILTTMHVTWAFVATAIVFHILSLFGSRGLARDDVALFFTLFAASMAGSQFVGGLLADRFRLNRLLLGSMVGMTFSVVSLMHLDDVSSVVVFAVTSGASQGLFIVLGQTIWVRFFGRDHLGEIRGTVWTACVAGSSVGPFVLGITKDYLGVFAPALWLFAGMYAVLSVASFWVTAPKPS